MPSPGYRAPSPDSQTPSPVAAIAEAARSLDTFRTAWLNPPEWTRVVFGAYVWDPAMTDEQLLEALLALNLERAGSS